METRDNTRDELFGDIDGTKPYQITSTHIRKSNKKRANIFHIIIAVVLCVVAAVLLTSLLKNIVKKYPYNGDYEMTKVSYNGIIAEVEQLEKMSGMNVSASLKIEGEKAFLDIDFNGDRESGWSEVTFDGAAVTFVDDNGTVYATYDEENKTITMKTTGADLIFEKVK